MCGATMKQRVLSDFNLMRALEVFVTVAETRQVTKAAEILGVTQSAASQNLQAIEKAYGIELFDRRSRPINLTRAGIALHKRAVTILNDVNELDGDLYRADVLPIPMLRFGMLASLSWLLSPLIVSIVRDQLGISQISMRSGFANQHQEQLTNRLVDILITSNDLYDVDGLERHTVLREPFYLLVPPAYEERVSDLSRLVVDLPMIRFAPHTPVGQRVDQHLRRSRVSIGQSIDADKASAVIAMVSAGQGFAVLPPTMILDGWLPFNPPRIQPLPLVPVRRSISLVAREGEFTTIPALLAEEIQKIVVAEIHRVLADHIPTLTHDMNIQK